MLTDEQEAQINMLGQTHGRVGHVEFEGHVLVFKRPTREQIKDYRRKEDSPVEKTDRVDQLAQQTIVAFDGVTDPIQCRQAFLSFLGEYPLFCDSPKMQTVISLLGGLMEEEHSRVLGKGCSVRSASRRSSQTG